MTRGAESLLEAQNQREMISLLRAMSVCHSHAQRLDNLRLALSVAIGVAGAFTTVADLPATPLTVIGALWAIINTLGLGFWSHGHIKRAATLQEMFDVALFGLPWNTVAAGEPISPHEVSRLDRAFRGNEQYIRDYYEIPDLPHPYDILACQQQNLGWGSRLRRRYAYSVLATVASWTAAGIAFGVAADLTVTQLLLEWFVPSLAALLLGLEIYRGQHGIAADRDRAASILQTRITQAAETGDPQAATQDLLNLARQIQDLILQTRQRQTRVPDWFFRRFHTTDRVDFQAAMARLATLLGIPINPPHGGS